MIINRVWSENVLKYAALDLNHLPREGLIAVSGQNESGKSTIGEIICFALFGRTFSIKPDEIVKAIRWGEPRCAASVDFAIGPQRYSVSRFLDENGTQGARLTNQERDEPFARGVDAVGEALGELLGFGFDEFIESFYLAQREITTPHPHSSAVKRMAGIAALENVATVAEIEIEHEHTSIADTERLVTDIESLIAEVDIDEELLPRLESRHQTVAAKIEDGTKQTAKLQDAAAAYNDTAGKVTTAIEPVTEAGIETPFRDWRTRLSRLEESVAEIAERHGNDVKLAPLNDELKGFVNGAKERLAEFDQIKNQAGKYREHLGDLLGEHAGRERDSDSIVPLADRQATLNREHDDADRLRGSARTGTIVLLLLALVGWVLAALLGLAPDAGISQRMADWFGRNLGDLQTTVKPLLVSAAVALTAGFAFFAFRGRNLGSKMEQLKHASDELGQQIVTSRREADAIDTLDATPLPKAVSVLAGMRDNGLRETIPQFKTGAGAAFVDAAGLDELKATLRGLADGQKSCIEDECQQMANVISSLGADIDHGNTELAALEESLAVERERRRKHDELKSALENHHRQIGVHKRRIDARHLAQELVEGGCRHIAQTFNRDVRNLVSRTLPLLTEGRYEHLKIDENLYVQVFSSEKRDFMHLEEISSGTQRQIMLAVRLALSQEFINTTLERNQFIFLDEPFAFFDQERTRAALEALPGLSDELRQLWIVAQEFPEGFPFDAHIRCSKETDRLSLAVA